MQSTYPTAQQILEAEYLVDPDKVKILKEWKETIWNPIRESGSSRIKKGALAILLMSLTREFDSVNIESTDRDTCMYDPITKTIYLDNSCSIISALHELGHHIYGTSELKACVFSINLFKSVFPKAYEKLHFEGHMLKK